MSHHADPLLSYRRNPATMEFPEPVEVILGLETGRLGRHPSAARPQSPAVSGRPPMWPPGQSFSANKASSAALV
jgi:hypothetical protein